MSTVISIENVTKSYRLGQIGGGTLKADVARWWAMLRGQPDPNLKIGEEHRARRMGDQFWALQDVSFEVKQGEVLGIIGNNGAGKSTLLKILSQVTTPTSGQIKIKGRIASLLEVGTGFNPEMTGRENVFLNGAILGMTKSEIRKKFDEIVAFSGVEEFIDTPVKRYSSGMYVRLAFAVAAHLEPEILIVDEVLAVGDSDFQKKCLGKMQDVATQEGRTVLFVSHSMTAIAALCNRVLLLNGGKLTNNGEPRDVLEVYKQSSVDKTETTPIRIRPRDKTLSLVARIEDVYLEDMQGTRVTSIKSDKPFKIHVLVTTKINTRFSVNVTIKDSERVLIWIDSGHLQQRIFDVNKTDVLITCSIVAPHLASGQYYLDCALTLPDIEWIDKVTNAVTFEVEGFDPYQSGFDISQRFARFHVDHQWVISRNQSNGDDRNSA